MDYPLSQADELDLYLGKFTNGEPGVRPASIIPAETINAVIDEITAVIVAAGIMPAENEFTQLFEALVSMFAGLVSPDLQGNPTAPTQALGNNSTRLANTAFVQATVSSSAVSQPLIYFMGQI